VNSNKHTTIQQLFIIFLVTFVGLIILGHSGQNSQHSTDNCQGFYLFGCVTHSNETSSSTGYGFPFNDVFIHNTKTINGKTASSYKAIDWHNVYQNSIFNLIVTAILTLPVFLVYKLIRKFLVRHKSRLTKSQRFNPAR
jgi:hypothetical protein